MSLSPPLLDSRLAGLAPHATGKVRDIFDLGDTLLLVATDRISAFDYVLGSGIPDKGRVLTQLSAFWFERTANIIANHVLTMNVAEYPAELQRHAGTLNGRSMRVRKTQPIAIECVAHRAPVVVVSGDTAALELLRLRRDRSINLLDKTGLDWKRRREIPSLRRPGCPAAAAA